YIRLARRLPPLPTLFPYTTLFRSVDHQAAADSRPRRAAHDRPEDRRSGVRPSPENVDALRQWLPGLSAARAEHGRVSPPTHRWLDRKSTRLNSSHGSISYAVFCLK